MIHVTVEQLAAVANCSEAIAMFRRYIGDAYEVDDYTLEDQLALIRGPIGVYWGRICQLGWLPAWSMADVDLRGADLRHTDLRGADLAGANLEGADLYRCDLRGADLQGAYLASADLRGADLRRANLEDADLRGARVNGANLRCAELSGSNWTKSVVITHD